MMTAINKGSVPRPQVTGHCHFTSTSPNKGREKEHRKENTKLKAKKSQPCNCRAQSTELGLTQGKEKPFFHNTELSEERPVRSLAHSSPAVGSGNRLGPSRWHRMGPTVGLPVRREPLLPGHSDTDSGTSQERAAV